MSTDNAPPTPEALLEARKLRAAEISFLLRRQARSHRTEAAKAAGGPAWHGWLYDADLLEEAAACVEKHYIGDAP